MRLLLLLALVGTAFADRWTYFYPESVTEIRCKVQRVEMSVNGMARGEDKWQAEAQADRRGMPNWAMQIGLFPPTHSGRHAAEKVCSKWLDEADKRMKASR